MPTLNDSEFGEITIRKIARAQHIRLKISGSGKIQVTMPKYAPLFLAKRLVESSRSSLRKAINDHTARIIFRSGDQIGKSHSLIITSGSTLKVRVQHQIISVTMPPGTSETEESIQSAIRKEVIKILRKEAKSYLPRRLAFLAKKHNLSYQRVRFSYASTRWGSCSSAGTISLNISLMLLPFELIDYVIYHELAHTVHMNHGKEFWSLVADMDPLYIQHKKALKSRSSQL